jgi:hypothetical protein
MKNHPMAVLIKNNLQREFAVVGFYQHKLVVFCFIWRINLSNYLVEIHLIWGYIFYINFRGLKMKGDGRGGKRPGAGRKPGLRAHSFQAVQQASAEAIQVLREENAEDPQRFLAGVMNRKNLPIELRMKAAEILMPFVHPRLSATAVVSQRVGQVKPDQVISLINERLARLVAPAPVIEAMPDEEKAA